MHPAKIQNGNYVGLFERVVHPNDDTDLSDDGTSESPTLALEGVPVLFTGVTVNAPQVVDCLFEGKLSQCYKNYCGTKVHGRVGMFRLMLRLVHLPLTSS